MNAMLLGAWQYRYFIFSSIKTDFSTKFIRSRLGGAWMILNPLVQVAIFAFILSAVLASKIPGIDSQYAYPIYLMSGILAWSLFTEVVTRCLTLFIDNGNLLKKLVFPKITLPLIVAGSALFNNFLLFLAIIMIFGVLGNLPGTALLWMPLLVVVNIALALGIGLICGVLNVFLRDIGQVVPVILQLLFWFTPIVYMENIIPPEYRAWLPSNPLFHIITGYHDVLLYNRSPDWQQLGIIGVLALILLALSLFMFRKASAEMVDVL
ncbi:ABC transporter permease [Azospirillum baldaniorum]|uniref:ABC transporter permease n=1 Tax=Azospirillum baldaniorum TaxID=1064539 RepID=UPI00157BA151|nr:ABC transporter permease [Azospirillum baldaniorum]